MASAGRILIMPKGNWNAETTYENLDLVFHGGTSWIAKKEVTGIEPSEEHSEHWFKMCEATDLTEVNNRLASAENRITELEIAEVEVDLTPYATAKDLTALNLRVGTAETKITSLEETLNGIGDSSANFSNRNVLDYDNKVVREYNVLPYTCPSSGEVTVYIKASGAGVLRIDKNGMPAAYLQCDNSNSPFAASTFPVASGDVINRNDMAHNISEGKITFVPYKYQ